MVIEVTALAALVVFVACTAALRRRTRHRSAAATLSREWLVAHRGSDQ
jgi:hypothetical protein